MPYIKAAGKNNDRCLRLTGSQDGTEKYYSGCSLRPLAANEQRFVLRFPNGQNKPTPFGYNGCLVISGTSPVNTPPDNAWSLNLLFETYQLLFHLAAKEDFKTIVFNSNMVPWGGPYTWDQGASQPSPLTPGQAFQIELVNTPSAIVANINGKLFPFPHRASSPATAYKFIYFNMPPVSGLIVDSVT